MELSIPSYPNCQRVMTMSSRSLLPPAPTGDSVFANFDSEDACIAYLFNARWPRGFRCPACGHSKAYAINSRRLPLYQCALCRKQTSLIAGTVMEGSRTPLRKWLIAIHLLSRENGVTALRLASLIRVTYKTAWLMLHKIRRAIAECDAKQPLTGTVETGLRYYDRLESIRRPRSYPMLVLGSVSEEGRPVYVKMKLAPMRDGRPDTSRPALRAFQARHVHGSVGRAVAFRMKINQGLHDLFGEAVAWINGTFHGLATRHMQLYWDEFCYRKNAMMRGEAPFVHLCGLCMGTRLSGGMRRTNRPSAKVSALAG